MIAQGNAFFTDIPILAYHRITQADPSKGLRGYAVSASQFERQMCYLHDHGYRCLSLMELLRSSGNREPHRKKTFVLTFDDGYEDFFTQGYPIFRRYGFTATVFLVTDCIGRQSNWEKEIDTPLLTWEQIEALHKQGISFGSHTCSHPRLTQLSTEQIHYELAASKERLEAELGQEIQMVAYPHGESNSEIQRIAASVGYQVAFGSVTGRAGRFNLWRCPCRADNSLLSFTFKLSKWYRYWMELRRWLREETALGPLHKALFRALRERRG